VAGGVAFVVAGGVAGVVAFVVAGVVAGVVPVVVAGGVPFVVPFGVAFVVAFGVAVGVAGVVVTGGGGLLGLVALAPSLVPGLLWAGLPWGLSARRSVGWLLFLGAGLFAGIGLAQGWGVALLALLPILAGGLRLWSSLAAAVAGVVAYFSAVGGRRSVVKHLRMVPPFSDEIVWTPVPFLDRLLVRAFEEDTEAGLEALETVRSSFRQGWAARRALPEITRIALRQCVTLEEIAEVVERITWLPEDLSPLGQDINELVPRLFRISRSVAVALESSSRHNRRLGLSAAADDLKTLNQSLTVWGGRGARARWEPVVAAWQRVLAAALERSALTAKAGTLPNPYMIGRPLHRQDAAIFRGREALRDAVATSLLGQERVTLVLYGPRRMGKTSFLQQLPNLLTGDVLPVFVDLQKPGPTRNASAFFYNLARAVTREARVYRVKVPTVERDTFRNDDPFLVFEDWLEVTLRRLQGWRLLLTLDEFEKLGEAVASGAVEEAVLDELRHLIQHQRQLTLLFAGVATLDELGPDFSSYFINTRALRMTYLLPDEAESLIRDPNPEVDFSLTYDDAVVCEILRLTHCQPALVQLLCSEIVEEVNARKILHATPDVLEVAIERALTSGGSFYFRNVWDEMTGTDEISIAAGKALLRQLAEADEPLPLDLDGADVATRRAVDRMVHLDVIEEIEGGYQFEVPLVKRWVAERAPVSFEE
jgi:hypothetical protein